MDSTEHLGKIARLKTEIAVARSEATHAHALARKRERRMQTGLDAACERAKGRCVHASNGVTVWRYSIGSDPKTKEGWGVFLLDSSGMFAAVSDYGNYAHQFSIGHCDPREFFAGLDKSNLGFESTYLQRKLAGEEDTFDEVTTLRLINESIAEIECDDTRMDEEQLLVEMSKPSGFDFELWCTATELDDPGWHRSVCFNSDVTNFCAKLYPRLVARLIEELTNG